MGEGGKAVLPLKLSLDDDDDLSDLLGDWDPASQVSYHSGPLACLFVHQRLSCQVKLAFAAAEASQPTVEEADPDVSSQAAEGHHDTKTSEKQELSESNAALT